MRKVLLSLIIVSGSSVAQWDIPVPLVLDGPSPEDRQIIGLADPIVSDAGVSVDAYRRNVVSSATSTGGSVLHAELLPAATSYAPGMSVYLTLSEPNGTGCTIRLNDLEEKEVVKWGGLPLDSADLIPNVPNRFVYDGERFQYMGNILIPCPSGYSIASVNFCIGDSSFAPQTFHQAGTICRQQGGRLCSFGEWLYACPRLFSTQLTSASSADWVDSAANSQNTAKIVGHGSDGVTTDLQLGCNTGSNREPTSTARFRCCFTR
jgi:hypothetical protein